MAGVAIAAAAAGGGAAVGGATAATAIAIAAVAAAASYASQSVARRNAQASERKAGTEGPTLASFRASDAPRQIVYGRVRTGGPLVYMEAVESNQWLLMDVALAGHECEAIDEVWLDEYQVPLVGATITWGARSHVEFDADTGYFTEVVDSYGFTGPAYYAAPGRYNVRDGVVLFYCELGFLGSSTQSASPLLMGRGSGKWTAAHRLRGITHVPLQFSWAPEVFQSGPPNPTFVVRGKRLYDPRLDSTVSGGSGSHRYADPSTWAYSNNSALCLLDYLLDARLGLGAVTSEIDFASFQTAADACDEDVTLASGATEKRYTTNGVLRTDAAHEANIEVILSAMDGKLVYSGGKFRLYAGAWTASVATFTEDDLRGPITIRTQQERAKVCNAVRGTFTDPAGNWQRTDFPAVQSATYYAEDQNEWLWLDLPLAMTTSSATAQRLAKIVLERSRRQIVVTFTAQLKALNVVPGDTVALTFPRYGWTAKTFIVDELKLVQELDDEGQPIWGVDLALREHDEDVYTWTANEEAQVLPAPTTSLPNPFEVAPPTNLRVTESLYSSRAPVVATRVDLAWDAAQDAFVSEYAVEWKEASETVWHQAPPARGLTGTVFDVSPGDYEWRVRSRNVAGNFSAYVTKRLVVYGISAIPAALADLTIQTAGGLAILQWTQSADLDVLVGGRIEVRHAPVTTGATWAASTPIGSAAPGSASLWPVPLKAGTYLLRPYDSSGNAGPVATVVTDGATALTYSPLSTLTEETAFSGTKTSTVAASSRLKLDSSGNLDSVADFDAIADVDGLGGIVASGSYQFATTMDLGSTKRVRLASHIKASIVAVLSRVDSRNPDIDDWPTFDGGDGDEAEVWVEVQDSTDNVTYSAWRRLDASEAQARYFKFRAQLRSYDADYNVEIEELRASASEVV